MNRQKTQDISIKKGSFRDLVKDIRKRKFLYFLLLAPLLYYIIFEYIPIYGIGIAFQDYLPGRPFIGNDWVGLKNFELIFSSKPFLEALRNTILISLGKIIFGFSLPIVIALLLNEVRRSSFKRIVQAAVYFPHFVFWVIIGSIMMIIINLFVFSMYFKGGLIPSYMLMRRLGLIDSYFAVILTGAISTYYMLVLRSFFVNIPDSLEDAAMIDGASESCILFRIILPMSGPAIATIALFYAVEHWNSYFYPMIYLNSREKWPLQVILREILFESAESMRSPAVVSRESSMGLQMKMAAVMVTVLPILMVYPFLQKYFIKGVLVGAVKA